MGQTKTTRSISATGLFLLIMMTVGLYSCTRTQKDIIPSADYAPYVNCLLYTSPSPRDCS